MRSQDLSGTLQYLRACVSHETAERALSLLHNFLKSAKRDKAIMYEPVRRMEDSFEIDVSTYVT